MFIFKTVKDITAHLEAQRAQGRLIAFVPTMGALHKGHLSLLQAAQQLPALTVCSIFVNPTQFNNATDLEKYPRTTEQDIALLTGAGCDVLFLPTEQEVYPDGKAVKEPYDLGYLETVLEGAYRPGHFQGVAQVVERLLQIVKPHKLYLGQKDFQQVAVLRRMIDTRQLAVQLESVPTTREPDGLAMSSRNRRLTESQRSVAGLIYQCLVSIQSKKGMQPFAVIQKECRELLIHKGFRPDYIELAVADTLELLPDYDPSRKMVALIAAYIGEIRLIDNLVL
ncbi:pantoate--beta-alanine ligase [Taibaiella koreensis]|uniref:pantoate--beta-alanine ligase n=1 Tax=Taibaiella koreensis TaxID=1268548 RepID=UPI000E59ABCE|nr:pantoate--beta-alanine ligase [Taibaiella koreensis]